MELFTVKRYYADEAEKVQPNENDILQNLLKKVEKRKRKHEQEVEVKVVPSQVVLEDAKLSVAETAAPNSAENDGDKDVDPITDEKHDFEVLGEDVHVAKRSKVDMVLPAWLAHPTVISTSIAADETDTAAHELSAHDYLAPHIRHSLKEMQFNRLFPVQSAVIPWILQSHCKPMPFRPRDICVSAPTGSGKTLAFAIPVVQLLAQRVERKIGALVVLPVAELALQVFKVFKKLCEKTDLTVCLLSKQFAFALEQEKLVEYYKGRAYSKVDIVVTTPGRLVDHLHATKGFCLKSLKFLVIDEADRIMDAVFQNWLYHLDAHVRVTSDQLLSGRAAPLCYNELLHSAALQPHKLLFSATLSQDPEKLQNLRLFQPKLFTSVLSNMDELREKFANASAAESQNDIRGEFIGKYTTPAELTEKYCLTESRLKPLTLYSLISENEWTKFLCFTNSAESSARLAFVLSELFQKKLVIKDLSAGINVKDRASVLSQFLRGQVNGLVCSDALARGIDIPDVDIVISYDPPRHIKTYIHRIGRTARAGKAGTAIMLLNQKELSSFNQTLAEVGKVLTNETSVSPNTEEHMAQDYSQALQKLRSHLNFEKRTKILRKTRAKQLATMHKDAAQLSVMEKLQMQAHVESQKQIDKPIQKIGTKKKVKLSK